MSQVVTAIQVTSNTGLKLGSSTNTTVLVNSATSAQSLTLPNATDQLVGRSTTDTLTNKTLTAPVLSSYTNSGTMTLPSGTDTVVSRNSTDTLTNKTLTLPVVASFSNGGILTLPSGTDTIVSRNSTDTLTNKTLVGGTLGNAITANQLASSGSAVVINSNAPSVGQALIATSATNATWQAVTALTPGLATQTSQTLTTTTGTANQLLETVPVTPTADVFFVTTKVVGFNTTTPGTTGGAVFEIKAAFVVNAGVVNIINTPSATTFTGTGFTAGDGYTFGDVTVAISGTNILINVNGQASQTINWKSSTQTMFA